jgi:hypothetical protein
MVGCLFQIFIVGVLLIVFLPILGGVHSSGVHLHAGWRTNELFTEYSGIAPCGSAAVRPGGQAARLLSQRCDGTIRRASKSMLV